MKNYLINHTRPLPLKGQVQRYAWGKIGRASRIAPFLSSDATQGPLAEYWLGAHPKAPAEVVLPDGTQVSILELLQDPAELPFMLKVLSINGEFGLSIQSHPDLELARRLHIKDPKNYPDPFHKPEAGIALSVIKLLYDIKSPDGLKEARECYPELNEVFSDDTRALLAADIDHNSEDAARLRKAAFQDCITADPARVSSVVEKILKRLSSSIETSVPEEVDLIARLSRAYGSGDPGLVVLLVMNLVNLQPGDAIFIGPNVPHAYLDGDLVECMACSDNVIRAGLTPKYRDVDTLIASTNYAYAGDPKKAELRQIEEGYDEFKLPVEEFCLKRLAPHSGPVEVDVTKSHAVVFCIGGEATLLSRGGENDMALTDGSAVLIPQGSQGWMISTDAAQVFIARKGVLT
jgi:mannose-6-phosphate isomerase